MGIAAATLGATGLGLVATTAQAAERHVAATTETVPTGDSAAGNAIDGHQLKGSGKAAQKILGWFGKQILGLGSEPPVATPTHNIIGKTVESGAKVADQINNQPDDQASGTPSAQPPISGPCQGSSLEDVNGIRSWFNLPPLDSCNDGSGNGSPATSDSGSRQKRDLSDDESQPSVGQTQFPSESGDGSSQGLDDGLGDGSFGGTAQSEEGSIAGSYDGSFQEPGESPASVGVSSEETIDGRFFELEPGDVAFGQSDDISFAESDDSSFGLWEEASIPAADDDVSPAPGDGRAMS